MNIWYVSSKLPGAPIPNHSPDVWYTPTGLSVAFFMPWIKSKLVIPGFNINSSAPSFEYFIDDVKIISNSGYGSNISKKAETISRLTACQSTLTLNDTSVTKFEQNELIKKVFGNSIINNFKSYDVTTRDESELLGCSATHNGYEKSFGCTHKREIYIDKENNCLKGIDHILKKKDGYPVRYSFRFHINPELTVVKTMRGNGALIQISKNSIRVAP